jgi:hypothetical protein
MLLSVKERLILQSILPREGSFVTLKIVRDLQSSISFSEEEIKLYKLVEKDNIVTWDEKVEQGKEISIGEKATDVIVNALKKLDQTNNLKMEHMDIYERFVK